MQLLLDTYSSPIGPLLLVVNQSALVALEFGDEKARMHKLLFARFAEVELKNGHEQFGLKEKLSQYFSGDFGALKNIALHMAGTEIQNKVWQGLCNIPAGQTRSYGELAAELTIKNARLIGQINGQNPIGIVVPCHRVIGADGSLTGYAGGLKRKHWLLQHEGALRQNDLF